METFDQIMQAISMVGFPIVAAGGLFWENHLTAKETRKALVDLKIAIDGNNALINKSIDVFEKFIGLSGRNIEE